MRLFTGTQITASETLVERKRLQQKQKLKTLNTSQKLAALAAAFNARKNTFQDND